MHHTMKRTNANFSLWNLIYKQRIVLHYCYLYYTTLFNLNNYSFSALRFATIYLLYILLWTTTLQVNLRSYEIT